MGLGYRQAPDGNQEHEFKQRTNRTKEFGSHAYFNQKETRILLVARLVTGAAYVLILSQFSEKQHN